MTLCEVAQAVATPMGGPCYSGLFQMAAALREYLDEEVVATLSREMFAEMDKHGSVLGVPLFHIHVAEDHQYNDVPNAFKILAIIKTSSSPRFVSHFYFVQEGDRFS